MYVKDCFTVKDWALKSSSHLIPLVSVCLWICSPLGKILHWGKKMSLPRDA